MTNALPQWLLDRPPLTPQELDEHVASARRYLERSTPASAVEMQRVIVALADQLATARAELQAAKP